MEIDNYILFWVCVIGLCLGSFYNVVILRSLSGESIVFPPSKCPKCGEKLYFWHNIPVLSYILLRGKCYFCHDKISIQYPIIELATMLVFAYTYIKFGISIYSVFVLLWVSLLIIMTVTDIKEKLVDCNLAIIAAVSAIIYHVIDSGISGVVNALLGLIVGVVVLEVIARVGGLIFQKPRAMGEADTYVAGALGAIAGFYNILNVLVYGFIFAMLFVIPVYWFNRYKNNDKMSCIFMLLFAIAAVTYKTMFQEIWMLGIVVITGVVLIHYVLKSINEEHKLSYIPYVPALSAGALYYLFSM